MRGDSGDSGGRVSLFRPRRNPRRSRRLNPGLDEDAYDGYDRAIVSSDVFEDDVGNLCLGWFTVWVIFLTVFLVGYCGFMAGLQLWVLPLLLSVRAGLVEFFFPWELSASGYQTTTPGWFDFGVEPSFVQPSWWDVY